MVKQVGKTQSDARIHNNKVILSLLRKGDMTQSELAQAMGLSIAAVSMITADLIKYELIKFSDVKVDSRKGRRPQKLSINGGYGCVAVVSLTDENIGYVIADMAERIVYSNSSPNPEKIEVKTLYEMILDIKRVIENEVKLPLRGIDISAPGKINKSTGAMSVSPHFSSEITAQPNFLPDLFHRYFDVPVKISNDINLAAIGEVSAGWLIDNALYVYIGRGVGSALILDGKLYLGSNGYAGEIGLIRRCWHGQMRYLDDIASLNGMCAALCTSGVDVTADNIIEKYLSGEKAVVEYVDSAAEELGEALKDIIEVLDLSDIRLAGGALGFGNKYIEKIRSRAMRADNTVKVDCSSLSRDACVVGAVSKAISNITAHIIEQNEFKSDSQAV